MLTRTACAVATPIKRTTAAHFDAKSFFIYNHSFLFNPALHLTSAKLYHVGLNSSTQQSRDLMSIYFLMDIKYLSKNVISGFPFVPSIIANSGSLEYTICSITGRCTVLIIISATVSRVAISVDTKLVS